MLKIAVVEDQTEVRESLCQFIRQYAGEQGLQAEVEPFADGAVIAEAVSYTNLDAYKRQGQAFPDAH